jgi:hypothetical protein
MKAQHTPGPWLMFFDGQFIGITTDREKHERDTDEKTAGHVSVEYVPIKAAIAAPDLLEALQSTLNAMRDLIRQLPADESIADYRLDSCEIAEQKAVEAIKKADPWIHGVTKPTKTYYIGLYSDPMNAGAYTPFVTKHRDNIPAGCKALRAISGKNKVEALSRYIQINAELSHLNSHP